MGVAKYIKGEIQSKSSLPKDIPASPDRTYKDIGNELVINPLQLKLIRNNPKIVRRHESEPFYKIIGKKHDMYGILCREE